MTSNSTLRKGRGATIRPDPRYLDATRAAFDDGWGAEDETPPPLQTHVTEERSRSIIAHNDSPDIPFRASINPYRGCEHGCVYCYARPTHAYLDLSPGIDFESRLYAKVNAAELLRAELTRSGYRPELIALGANTDPYQPIERKYKVTRRIIEVLAECDHPFSIVTKSALVERDIDLLAPMAAKGLLQVYVSITGLNHELARRLEPRAAAPRRRVETVRRLSEEGIPVGVMFAPVIPALNDCDLEQVLEASAEAGARFAGYVMIRLPLEIKELFKDWLSQHYPLKASHVMNMIRDLRGGKEYDSQFGTRQRGIGHYAALIARRFELACDRLGLNKSERHVNTALFKPPAAAHGQLQLF
ncbi:MAG: PA0069 family radical SAM protein [Chromatiales bacterium]